jgi:xylulokinase
MGVDAAATPGAAARSITSPREAVEVFRREHADIDLVVLDMVTPEMTVEETFGALRTIDPKVAVLLVSGFTREARAEDILAKGARRFLQKPFRADEIVGIGLSGQMHGSVFLDANHEVIRPALLWNDQRTAQQCAWITSTVGCETIVSETCNPVLTGFQAPKIIWLRDNEPANYERVSKVLLPKDYIRYRLTGEFATEVSDASGTALCNVPERRWSNVILDKLALPREWFPDSYESTEVTGAITAEVAALTGLKVATPVVGGGGDQAAGGVGNGIVEAGAVSCTTGTSGVVFAYLDQPVMDEQLRTHTFCHAVPGKWHVMGAMLSAGGSLQ